MYLKNYVQYSDLHFQMLRILIHRVVLKRLAFFAFRLTSFFSHSEIHLAACICRILSTGAYAPIVLANISGIFRLFCASPGKSNSRIPVGSLSTKRLRFQKPLLVVLF